MAWLPCVHPDRGRWPFILVGLLGLGFYFAALTIALAEVTAIGQTTTLFVTCWPRFCWPRGSDGGDGRPV